jgi:polyferredoxin
MVRKEKFEIWNNLKYWQRGGIVAFIITVMLIFLFSLWADHITSAEPVSFKLAFIIMFTVYVIPATVAGFIVGWVIGKFVKK